MQKLPDQTLLYSPSDLIRLVGSPFASWVKRYNLEHPGRKIPEDPDPEDLRILQDRGIAHEEAFLQTLRDDGRDVYALETGGRDRADLAAETLQAMEAGHEVIFQAYLSVPPFQGYADFLYKVPGASRLGDHHYEPWDTKLALQVKPYFMVQLCCYAELLEHLQGVRPEQVGVILGNREEIRHRTADFFYAYRAVKQAFFQQMAGDFSADAPLPFPEPGLDHRPYGSYAENLLLERDHLSQVANITRAQIQRLETAGVHTMKGLGETGLTGVPGISQDVFDRLREQADLQDRSRDLDVPLYRVLPSPPETPLRGLARLPPPSDLDVFFDMEGYPHAEGGLEYLFGATYVEGGELAFKAFWAHDPQQERVAFEAFIDWIWDRWTRDRSMHIYHYAPYEVTAMRALMGKHGTREDRVDALLRNQVFVDLYKVVAEGLRVGEPSYSIKNLEHIYWRARVGEITDAGASIVQYQRWMESDEPQDIDRSPLLKEIYDYNKDDCDSTKALYDWLREEAKNAGITYAGGVDPDTDLVDDEPVLPDAVLARLALRERLLKALPADRDALSEEPWRVHQLFTELLEFHHREKKPVWWRMYDWRDRSHAELAMDPDCLGDLIRMHRAPEKVKRSMGFWYSFDPDQETKLDHRGNSGVSLLDHPEVAGSIEKLLPTRGELLLKLGPKALKHFDDGDPPALVSLYPRPPSIPPGVERALTDVIGAWAEDERLAPALESLLYRLPPDRTADPLVPPGADPSVEAVRLAGTLGGTTLCVQGPPGAGKTWTGARMILDLLRAGKTVGITANSHKAILNLLSGCCEAAQRVGQPLDCIKVGGSGQDPFFQRFPHARHAGAGQVADLVSDGVHLVGGTAWTFARPELTHRFDVLFVDEAGQFSLANLVGISRCTTDIVLLGDQRQLAQPIQGSHPGRTGLSALDYLLEDHAVIPPDLGIFLDRTWRMHPDLCAFVSDAFYEGQLGHAPETANRRLLLPDTPSGHITRGTGLLYVPVQHTGNTYGSDEEVGMIRELIDELTALHHTDKSGQDVGPLRLKDILVVAPYNLQVRKLREGLPDDAAVGTVDKFQGQEAPVAILSMGCSDVTDSGRGLSFLFEPNRVNVALSRAQALSIVVASPALGQAHCGSLNQLRLSNLFCRIVQGGEEG